MTTWLISDLHLVPDQPALIGILLRFLAGPARDAEALYLLGDVFNYWLGDDASLPRYPTVNAGMRALANCGVEIYFQHGNRDFLVDGDFCVETGAQLLPPETVVRIGGVPTLLLHGDSLCTDDIEHQKFRAVVLDPEIQLRIRSLPIGQRERMAETLRFSAAEEKSYKPDDIMDVNEQAVLDTLQRHQVRRMIHGHTHRPAIHALVVDGQPAERIVLPDWRRYGAALKVDAGGKAEFVELY